MVQRLHQEDILQNGAQIRLTRASLDTHRPKTLHDHDFFELFWVQNGQVRHHLPDRIDVLNEGTVCFVQPQQQHALQGKGDHSMVVSLSLHHDTVLAVAERHTALKGHLFWSQRPLSQHHRDIRQMAALNHAAVLLERSNCDTLAAEAFLLPLCAELTADNFPTHTPGWLVDACIAAKDPEIFRQGAAGFAALTGKAHPHVSRTMRKIFDQTPSDYVNSLRMTHAARALVTDNEPVSMIAANVGIPNMSHFHKLFRQAHNMTPLQYRQKYQRQLVQP